MPPRQGRYQFFGGAMPIFEEARLKERLRLGLVFDGGHKIPKFNVCFHLFITNNKY